MRSVGGTGSKGISLAPLRTWREESAMRHREIRNFVLLWLFWGLVLLLFFGYFFLGWFR
jgi:hypothetical protein